MARLVYTMQQGQGGRLYARQHFQTSLASNLEMH